MALGDAQFWSLGLPFDGLDSNTALTYWSLGLPYDSLDSSSINIAVPAATLVFATFAPVVDSVISISVPLGTLVVTAFTPMLSVAVEKASLAFATYAPVAVPETDISVPVATLAFATFVPRPSIEVPTVALVITTYAPSAASIINIEIPVQVIVLTTFTPMLNVAVDSASNLVIAAYAPAVAISIGVPAGTLAFTGYIPFNSSITITVPAASLAFTKYAPVVGGVTTLIVPVGALSITGHIPRVVIGDISACAERFGPKLYYWEPSYLERPEDTFLRATDWDNGDYQGLKFVQGFILEADTEGATRTIKIQGDQSDIETITINHPGQVMKPYSLNQPVQKHLLRILPTDLTAHWRLFGVKWVFEPAPEFAKEWKTQGTDHDIPGYQFLKDVYIAHNSTVDITLNITIDNNVFTYIIPNSGGVYVKSYLLLAIAGSGLSLKGTLFTYELTSSAPFQLFRKDCEVRVHAWSGGSYMVKLPFGDIHRTAGARI